MVQGGAAPAATLLLHADAHGRLPGWANDRIAALVEVADAEIIAAMVVLFERVKTVAEPAGQRGLGEARTDIRRDLGHGNRFIEPALTAIRQGDYRHPGISKS